MKKINWKSERKRAIWINIILFRWDKLFQKRDCNQWVFGGREGHQFDDNCRYFFEWVNKNHPEIKTAWLCLEEDLAVKIRNLGFDAYTFKSKEGIEFSKHAGVSIYSNGLVDFGYYPRVGGSLIVSLWHGVSHKKIYNMTYSGFSLFAKKCLDKLFSWTYRDISITTSEFVNSYDRKAFGLGKNAILRICGQPRNDVLFSGLQKKEVLRDSGVDESKKVILYMPTYRMPAMGTQAMEIIVRDLYSSKELDEALTKTNSVFIAKLHPLTPHIDIENRENFVILDYGAVKDNQKLLAVGDMMITDYSSAISDFALLERPIAFYMPDNEKFLSLSEPMCDGFFDICKHNRCETPAELAAQILNPNNQAVDAINKVFEDPSIKGTCYCENVYNAICKEVGL